MPTDRLSAARRPRAIGIDAHQPRADRPRREADREDRRRLEQLRRLIALGEEYRREIEREGGIGIPVEPLDQIAGRPAEDGAQPPRRR